MSKIVNILAAIVFLTESVHATIILVPGQFPTVQQALDAASEYDTVLVSEGTYYENLRFPSVNLVLASRYLLDGDTTHIPLTVLDGSNFTDPDTASVIYMNGLQDSCTQIVGFTITGGRGTLHWFWNFQQVFSYGGGIYCFQAAPKIGWNILTGNTAFNGGGIYLGLTSDALILHNDIGYNYADYWGAGMKSDSCSPTIIANQIHHNNAFQDVGIHIMDCGTAIIAENNVHHNTGVSVNAITIVSAVSAFISDNVISENSCDPTAVGGAGIIVQTTNATILNNQFLYNTGGGAFGALCLGVGSSGIVSGNLFEGNTCTVDGGGISMYIANFVITDNEFIDNSCPWGGAGFYITQQSTALLERNTFSGNVTEQPHGSAVSGVPPYTCTMRDNNISGNSPPAVYGYEVTGPFSYLMDASYNWWGDASGPYHPILNPSGLGDAVGDSVLFDPWLTEPVWAPPEEPRTAPERFLLSHAFPNPFNPSTTLRFQLPVAGKVNLSVYDVAGRLVARLVDGWRNPGSYQVIFNGSDLASGLYIYQLQARDLTASGKMVLVK